MDARDPHVFIGLKTCGGDNIREPRNTTQPALLMLKIPSERLGERKHTIFFFPLPTHKKKPPDQSRAAESKSKLNGRPKTAPKQNGKDARTAEPRDPAAQQNESDRARTHEEQKRRTNAPPTTGARTTEQRNHRRPTAEERQKNATKHEPPENDARDAPPPPARTTRTKRERNRSPTGTRRRPAPTTTPSRPKSRKPTRQAAKQRRRPETGRANQPTANAKTKNATQQTPPTHNTHKKHTAQKRAGRGAQPPRRKRNAPCPLGCRQAGLARQRSKAAV